MYFGLAIQVPEPDSTQFHAATLYLSEGRLMIGDVQSHLQSRRAEVRDSNRIFWVAPDLSQEDQRILAAKADAWLEVNEGKIPYSVADPGGVVFKDDVWVGNEPGQGLTCATFIVALFDELGIPFLDTGGWESRDGDSIWAEGILAMISESMTHEHVEAQRERLGETIRVRPSDIAASGILISQKMDRALRFGEVAPLAQEIEIELLNRRTNGDPPGD